MRASRSGNIWQHVDWTTIGLFLILVLFGWLNIYGASYTFDQTSIFDFSNRAGKQFTWILGSVVMGIVLLLIDYKTYDVLAYVAYGAMVLLLLATPFLAHDIKGSMSWISLRSMWAASPSTSTSGSSRLPPTPSVNHRKKGTSAS